MHGHEPIIAMRLQGRKPGIVMISDHPDVTAKDWHCPGEKYGQQWAMDHATVCVDGDDIGLLDLRFLRGLRVSIGSESEARAKVLFERCKAAGAVTVAACHSIADRAFFRSGWTEIFHAPETVTHG